VSTLNQNHIVRFIAAFSRGTLEEPEHYLVTELADGGNLRDLWRSMPNPPLQPLLMKTAVGNLRGLVEALSAIHRPISNEAQTYTNWRHGDLKPENILWFRDGGAFGTLKMCDFGEAKGHQAVTAMRNAQHNSSLRHSALRAT
jgi:serine/threonine protein kinase